MLQSLHLHNFALSQNSEITLDSGFNVITGETGAGKSLLLDALMLAMGGRGGSDMVRFGAKSADIYASFSFIKDNQTSDIANWFLANEREFDGDIVIRRQIHSENRSKAWLNGVPVSLSELKQLGNKLVSIHSQHAGLELLKPAFALSFLDNVGKLNTQRTELERAYHDWQALIKQQADIAQNMSGRADRITLLQSKLSDIEPLLGVDIKGVESAYEELANIEALTQDAYQASSLLVSDGDMPCVQDLLGRALKLCEQNSTLSETFATSYTALSECYELIRDSAMTLQDYSETQTADGEELERLNTILSLAHRLEQKYRTPIATLLEDSQAWLSELQTLESLPDADNLSTQIDSAYAHYERLAKALHNKRIKIAPSLCSKLVAQLAPLALPNASCEFAFYERKTASSHGLYDIELLFSANIGMPLLPLHKVASGGELSRIALVMQVMNASTQSGLPLLVFDEVDVGISGGTAQVVGELLRKLGNTQQIIAITHQAQVAACSHCHILVEKEQGEQATSQFKTITGDKQVTELARMSGGVTITQETLAHAKSLLTSIAKKE